MAGCGEIPVCERDDDTEQEVIQDNYSSLQHEESRRKTYAPCINRGEAPCVGTSCVSRASKKFNLETSEIVVHQFSAGPRIPAAPATALL